MIQLATSSFVYLGNDYNPLPDYCTSGAANFIVALEKGEEEFVGLWNSIKKVVTYVLEIFKNLFTCEGCDHFPAPPKFTAPAEVKVHQWLTFNLFLGRNASAPSPASDFTGVATYLFNQFDQKLFGANLAPLSTNEVSAIEPCTKDLITSNVSRQLGNIRLDDSFLSQYSSSIDFSFYNSRILPKEANAEIESDFMLESGCKHEFCSIPVGLSKVSLEHERSTEA